MAGNNNSRVIRYRRKPKAAAIIFAVVLIYIICFFVMYISKSKVQIYEAEIGSLSNNATYSAVIVRQEKIFNSDYSGNVNYYQREASRVKSGDTVYTVDETGKFTELLSKRSAEGGNSLSTDSLNEIKETLNEYKMDYDNNNFAALYDLKADLNGSVLQSINESVMNNIDSVTSQAGSQNFFQTIKATENGIVVYSVDGYENVNESNISSDMFDKSKYSKNNLKSESLIVDNNPAYKLITSEDWYILIPLNDSDIEKYSLSSKRSIKVKFKKDNIEATGAFSIVNKDGNNYGKVSFDKYMIRYATERIVDVEIISSGKSGIKIPVSSVTESEFYTIPKEYLTTGGNSNSYGFITEKYGSDGQLTTTFSAVDIYKTTDDYCYVSKNDFTAGTSVVKPDSSSRYVIGPTEKLKGVYCVNTGYTVFKLVEIYDGNNEYYIVKQNVSYGVSVYDRIVLDASKYTENQMIY